MGNGEAMPAITLWQPWATWIAWKWKTIETRGHGRFAGLRGRRIAIHAGKHFDPEAVVVAYRYLSRDQAIRAIACRRSDLPSGAIVCTAFVVDHRLVDGADAPDALCPCAGGHRYGLDLCEIVPLDEPIPCKGNRLVWHVPADVNARLMKEGAATP